MTLNIETDLEVLLEHEEEHAALRSDDGAVEGAAVVGQPREDRVELVVEVLVVDVLRLARLEVVTRLRRRRRVEILRGNSDVLYLIQQKPLVGHVTFRVNWIQGR